MLYVAIRRSMWRRAVLASLTGAAPVRRSRGDRDGGPASPRRRAPQRSGGHEGQGERMHATIVDGERRAGFADAALESPRAGLALLDVERGGRAIVARREATKPVLAGVIGPSDGDAPAGRRPELFGERDDDH